MSKWCKELKVELDREYHEDEAVDIMNAIYMIKGVLHVDDVDQIEDIEQLNSDKPTQHYTGLIEDEN